MKRAAIYLRRSTDRQEQSIPDQRKADLKYASENGYTVVREYLDDAVSGTSGNKREAFQRMMRDACQPTPEFRFIITYDVSRFSRGDVFEAGSYIHKLREHGIEAKFVADGFTGADTDDLLFAFRQLQARQDVKDTSEKTFRGLLTSAEKGVFLGGVPAYGYDVSYENTDGTPIMNVRFLPDGRKEKYDSDGKLERVFRRYEPLRSSKKDRRKLVLGNPEHVKVVVRIFYMYVREGKGLKRIAQELNSEGIRSPRDGNWSKNTGHSWSIGTIRSILRNPTYVGDMVWNRRSAGKFHRVEGGQARERSRAEFEKFKNNGQEDWVLVRDTHPAIVDRATFEEAQRLMAERGRKHLIAGAVRFGRAKNSPYLLSGVIKCARCGHAYQGHGPRKAKRRKDGERIATHYYACGGYISKGNAVCRRHVLRQQEAEQYVLGRITERVERLLAEGGTEMLRELIARELGAEREGPRRQKQELERKLRKVEEDIDRLLDNLTEINREFVDEKLVKLGQEKKALEEKLKEVGVMPDEKISPDDLARQIVESLRGFKGLFEQGTWEEKKEFVRIFVEKLEVDPDRGKGKLYIKQFPALQAIRTGNCSFNMVAGARFEPATSGQGPSR